MWFFSYFTQANRLTEDENDEEEEDFSQLLKSVDVRELEMTDNITDIDLSEVIQPTVDVSSEEQVPDLDESDLTVIQEPMDYIDKLMTQQEGNDLDADIITQIADSETKDMTWIQKTNDPLATDLKESKIDSISNEMPELEKSFLNLSIVEEQEASGKEIVEPFGFTKFIVPPLLTRHPPPAVGRDDDISKIREILMMFFWN